MTDINQEGTLAQTPRLVIRPWRLDEADRLFDVLGRTEVARWLGPGALMIRPEEATRRIEQWSAELASEPGFGRWAAVDRSSGIPAGTVVLKPLPDGDGEVEIGWYFHPDSWRRGLARESAEAVLAHGFAMGLQEVWAVTHLDNERSAAVCRKIGMRLLGVTKRWYHEPSLMFWVGAHDGQQPTLSPDRPVKP